MNHFIWRVTHTRHADTAFSGKGAELWGGRWNSPGHPVVYLASTLSLAILEILVHTKLEDLPDAKFVAFRTEVPDHLQLETYTVQELPSDWQAKECPALATMGDQWLTSESSSLLAVPSVVVPQEKNYLLNPKHSDFIELTIGSPESLILDPRLWE